MSETYWYYMEDGVLHRFHLETEEDYDDIFNPRKNDDGNIGKMVCWHPRYNLGDEQCNNPDEYLDSLIDEDYDTLSEMTTTEKLTYLTEKDYVFLPIAMYEHSGITIWCGSKWNHYDAQWDCSDIGFIYTTKKRFKELYGEFETEHLYGDKWKTKAEMDMKAEVDLYDEYIQGNIYCYFDETFDPYSQEWEDGDSCGGFISGKWGEELAREIANNSITDEPFIPDDKVEETIQRVAYPLLYMYG